ncbi:MAG: hypothetical protein IKQ81_00485 [Clostridiales bacterium]|nr:hypothetical protein [Clostridiales bacterium]
MITHFKGKKISSILGVLPENDYYFDDEVTNYSFPVKQTLRLKKVMGYEKHSLVKEGTTVSDLAIFGIEHILKNNWISKEEIGAVIVVSLCPDNFVPHISSIIHGHFNLGNDVLCLDIPQGCCGYLVGLMESFMLLDHLSGKKVVLVNGDILSRKVSHYDRNDFPLIGDGATVSIIENSDLNDHIYFELNYDGSRRDALIIPAGGFRMPSSSETAVLHDLDDGNKRSLDNMKMDGTAIFNFVQNEVPVMINRIFKDNALDINSIDYFFFHQPNRFLLQKLAEKLGVGEDKLPMNLVEKHGNPSGCSIPLVILLNAPEDIYQKEYDCCLSAFGSGLAWGTILMRIGRMDNLELIRSDL